DDFPRLAQALSAAPADADALFALADALREDPLGNKAAQGELAIAAVQAGLAALDKAGSPTDWARGQVTLGNAYADRIRGERADNLERALAAYQQALTVYTPSAFPVQWATTTYNISLLHATLSDEARQRGDAVQCRVQRATALAAMRATLDVYTADGFPEDHADALRQIARIEAIDCDNNGG
ncbi:MAG: hypothetical protein ACRDHE_04310, partial [Ktedonobacterales bacterium]